VPGRVTVFDRFGAPFDYATLGNWVTPTIQARSGKAESLNDEFTYKLDVRRELDFLPWNFVRLAAKTGYHLQDSLARKWGVGTGYRQTYTGPALTSSGYLDTTYAGYSPGFGFGPQQWISTYRLYDIYAANPSLFNANSDSDQVNNWNSYVNQNKRIKDRSDAWYAMFEGKALSNRLTFVTGIRQEESRRTGFGPLTDSKWNFLKISTGELYRDAANPNGVRIDQATSPLFATTAAGTALRSALTAARVAFPDHVVLNTTLEGRRLQLKPLQPVNARSKGDPSYSFNTAYNVTDQLVAKVAWSRTFGRISLEDGTAGLLSGNGAYVINEAETAGSIPAGTIAVANPSLKPWSSDNWDFAVTYYSRNGGKFGASYYTKTISNFQETLTVTSSDATFAEVLDALGLVASEYRDWNLTTSINGTGTAKTSGWEFDASQDLRALRFLGDWGRRFQTFVTYSKKRRSENSTTRLTARPAADALASGGIQFATNRFSAMLKATWTDLKFESNAANVVYNGVTYPLGTYAPAVTKVDANVNFQLNRRYSLFVSGRDILNRGNRKERFDLAGLYPAYAHWDDLRRFGVQITAGIKGSF
jgi:outer membrane receptor protein involved in Fe transport